jgi:hypothetical protein
MSPRHKFSFFVFACACFLVAACLDPAGSGPVETSAETDPSVTDSADGDSTENDPGEDTVSCSEVECGPVELRTGYFPLAVGNSWVFSDTLIVNGADSVNPFVLRISWKDTATRALFGNRPKGLWWTVQRTAPAEASNLWTGWMPDQIMRRGDTLFSLEYAFASYHTALRYMIPAGPDTVEYSVHEGDVPFRAKAVRLNGEFSVQAGTFEGCVSFLFEQNRAIRAVVCPDVGWVFFEFRHRETGALERRISLTSYSLKR